MKHLATTKMSSKGQVVIPEAIRNKLALHAGDHFVVLGDRDVIILKAVNMPSLEDLDHLVKQARKQARQSGLTKAAVKDAIIKARQHC